MAQRARLRASDQDREHVAERLRNATAEGRLLAEELEERLAHALRAQTYGELDALVADIPRGQVTARRERAPHAWVVPAVGLAIAIPLAVVMIIAAVFVLTTVFTAWLLWVVIMWRLAGHRRGRPLRHMRRGYGPGLYIPRVHGRPGSWR